MAMMSNVITQAYRTTCTPKDNRLDAFIPSEYVGRELEIIIMPLAGESQPRYNAETEAAMQEARDIKAGKIKAKRYETVEEMHSGILAEEDG